MLDLALVVLVVLPSVVGAALLLGGAALDRFAASAGIGTTLVLTPLAFLVAFPAGAARPAVATPFVAGADLSLAVDGLAAPVLPTVALVSLLVLVSATGSHELRTARFQGLMLLFVAAALLTVVATTLPTLLLSWEVMGATSYALIGFHWRDPVAMASGTTAFLTTRTADLGLYVAAGAALAGGGGLGLAALTDASPGWRHVIAAGLVVAGLGKAAQLPFSFWLARAMHGPSPVSALLHSAAMVALGGYLLLRVSPTLASTGWADDATAWVGATTAVVLGMVALAQRDLKQLLAASTAAQLGYVLLAAGVGATAAGASHLVAHAAVKAGLFLAAGLWLEALGTKRLSALGGAARRWPVVGACSAAALLALAGLPPLSLWATKDAVLAGAWEHSALLYVTGLVGAALAAAYAAKALVVLLRPAPSDVESGWDEERQGTRAVPRRSAMALVPLALGAVTLGLLALPPLAGRTRELVGGRAPEPGAIELLISSTVAVLAFVLTVVVARRSGAVPARRVSSRPSVLEDWLHLERLTHRWLVRPVIALADVLARVDDSVLARGAQGSARSVSGLAGVSARADSLALDRGVAAVARWSIRAAEGSGRADDAVLDAGVRRLAGGTRALGRLAQRPQTGQLHHYYLQALFVLGVVVLVLVLVR